MSDYGFDAYKKEMNAGVKSVSKEIRKTQEPGHVPLVHKPVFENINRKLDKLEKENNKNLEEENLKKAEKAAKSGTWFGRKKSASSEDVKEAVKNLTSGGLIKVPGASNESESIYRRVAKFLVIVGIDEAAKILPHLTEEQTERIIPEIATIQKITPEEKAAILDEFDSLLVKAREEGGIETARTILSKAYGSVKAEQLIARSVQYQHGKPFEYLADADAERIKLLIEGESVGIQAIVLSQIEPKKSAKVINLMDVEDKKNIVLRLAKMQSVSPEVMKEIDHSLHEKLLTQNTENSENLDGRGVLAQILKRMNPSAEYGILDVLTQQDPELGADLRKRLFTEEDVVGSDDRYIQNYLHDMENRDVAILILKKSDEFREKILSNVSKNRRADILEEEAVLGVVTKADSERLTSQFYAVLRRAWEKGDLRVKGRDEDEIFV